MEPGDAHEVAELVYGSINVWYRDNGHPEIRFQGGPAVAGVFYETYGDLDARRGHVVAVNRGERPDRGLVLLPPAADARRARDHERPPELLRRGGGQGAPRPRLRLHGRERLPRAPADLERAQPRLVLALHEIRLRPATRLPGHVGRRPRGGARRLRPRGASACAPRASPTRRRWRRSSSRSRASAAGPTTRYAIENARGHWHAAVLEGSEGGIDGYVISSGSQAMNIVGPLVARTEDDAIALLARELDRYRGRAPLALVPGRAAANRGADVRVGRAELGAPLLPGARRVPAVPRREHAHVHAGDRVGPRM